MFFSNFLKSTSGPDRFGGWFHIAWFGAALLIWLIPLYYTGTRHGSVAYLPRRVTFQHAAAALFTDREASWNQLAFLVRTGSSEEWIEVDGKLLSRSQLAGYRNRLDRLVPMARRATIAKDIWRRLGTYVAVRYAAAHPNAEPVTEVRLVNTNWPTNLPEMTHPRGHWQIPPIADVPPERLRTLVTVQLRDGAAVAVTEDVHRSPAPAGASAPRTPPVPPSAPRRRLRPFSESSVPHEAAVD
jgi:hypothetical protein